MKLQAEPGNPHEIRFARFRRFRFVCWD